MAEEEQRLVAAAQRGDIESYNQLVRLYEIRVFNMCLRMLSDREQAADVAQDVFLNTWRKLGTYRGGVFRSWLLRITTNACYDALRANRRRPTVSLDAPMGGAADGEPLPIADEAEGPEDAAQRAELAAAIQRGLADLPPDQRAVVVLCDIQGLSYEEIAIVTDSAVGTVKSRISRGRARLREALRATELLPDRYRHGQ